jgi:branched-chain amino acid transport system permease protein
MSSPTNQTTAFHDILVWIIVAAGFLGVPMLFHSGSALSTQCLVGIMIILALSYNVLFGQTGMLSFGHAVYFGLGGYITIHAMNMAIAAQAPIPVALFPLVGGFAGLFFAAGLGWICTRRGGTAFAMITLGIGELVVSLSLIMTGFFGEENGFSTNRTHFPAPFGYKFGPTIQVYYLVAVWCFFSVLAMYLIRRTPFGLACKAVRDNPERAEFIGFNPQIVRYLAFCIGGLFAGIAGALSVINFEIINATSLTGEQSAQIVLMTYIGGAGTFVGPIVGAVLITLLRTMLSDVTQAWPIYYGILFMLVIMYLPGGLAGWLALHAGPMRDGRVRRLVQPYAAILIPFLLVFSGVVLIVESSYRILGTQITGGVTFDLLGLPVDAASLTPWMAGSLAIITGTFLIRWLWPMVSNAWSDLGPLQTDLEATE